MELKHVKTFEQYTEETSVKSIEEAIENYTDQLNEGKATPEEVEQKFPELKGKKEAIDKVINYIKDSAIDLAKYVKNEPWSKQFTKNGYVLATSGQGINTGKEVKAIKYDNGQLSVLKDKKWVNL